MPQRNTNWVLMRSTACVSEAPIQFFYIPTPELLPFPCAQQIHTAAELNGAGWIAPVRFLFLAIITWDREEQAAGLTEMETGPNRISAGRIKPGDCGVTLDSAISACN